MAGRGGQDLVALPDLAGVGHELEAQATPRDLPHGEQLLGGAWDVQHVAQDEGAVGRAAARARQWWLCQCRRCQR